MSGYGLELKLFGSIGRNLFQQGWSSMLVKKTQETFSNSCSHFVNLNKMMHEVSILNLRVLLIQEKIRYKI
jgi:hypothetical protein